MYGLVREIEEVQMYVCTYGLVRDVEEVQMYVCTYGLVREIEEVQMYVCTYGLVREIEEVQMYVCTYGLVRDIEEVQMYVYMYGLVRDIEEVQMYVCMYGFVIESRGILVCMGWLEKTEVKMRQRFKCVDVCMSRVLSMHTDIHVHTYIYISCLLLPIYSSSPWLLRYQIVIKGICHQGIKFVLRSLFLVSTVLTCPPYLMNIVFVSNQECQANINSMRLRDETLLHLSILYSYMCLSIHPFIYPATCTCILYQSIQYPYHPYVCPSIYLAYTCICPSHLSIHRSIYLSSTGWMYWCIWRVREKVYVQKCYCRTHL